MSNKIAKEGDTITWVFEGKTFTTKVVMVDFKEEHYCVYTDYGQDLIDFDKVIIINR